MIKRVFTYSLFTFAFILVSVTFITATNFSQLGVAMIIYLIFALFAYKAFPHFWGSYSKKPDMLSLPNGYDEKIEGIKVEETKITDIDKRAFLKIIGAAGLSFFLISLFGRRVESFLFGQNLARITGTSDVSKTEVGSPASAIDEYSISGFDHQADAYFGYIKKDGSWYIMKEDPNTKLFLYAKGNSKFPKNWENRKNLKYDYYNSVFKP